MDDATLYMLLALLFFAEVGILLVQFQTCSDHIRRKRNMTKSKENKYAKRCDVLEQEITILENQLENLRHIVEN